MSADGARKVWIECDSGGNRVVIDYYSITGIKYGITTGQVPYCTVFVDGGNLFIFSGTEADQFRGLFDAAKGGAS